MIYVVSGMCRSGTSMVMHALIKGGIPAIYDIGKADARLLWLKEKGYDANPDGLFELYKSSLLKRFPNDLNKECVKIQDWQWEGLSGEAKDGILVVYMLRNKTSVFKSCAAFTGSMNFEKLEVRYSSQFDIIEQIEARTDVVSVTVLNYENVVKNPDYGFGLLKTHGFPINVTRAASVVKPEYAHFRSIYD